MIRFRFIPPLLLAVLSALPVLAREAEIAGPVAAEILRVIDGDTLLVEAHPWPQQRVEVYVRLRGIDTPELRSACPGERDAAHLARQALTAMAGEGSTVWLRNIAGDKYFGRIVADVMLPDGRNPAEALRIAGLAVAYEGGGKPAIDCVATGAVE